jgi:hypothetical protein
MLLKSIIIEPKTSVGGKEFKIASVAYNVYHTKETSIRNVY